MSSKKSVPQICLSMLPRSDHSASLGNLMYMDDNFLPPQLPDDKLPVGKDQLIDISPRFPYKPMFTFVLFLLEGQLHARVNLKEYRLGPCDVIVCRGGIIVDMLKITPDIKTGVFAFDENEFFADSKEESVLALRHTVMSPQVIHLDEQKIGMIKALYQISRSILKMDGFTYKRDAASGLLRLLTAGMAEWVLARPSRGEEGGKRDELLFVNFLQEVQAHCAQERRIGYYAAKFYMSPKYFAKLIYDASGRHAGDWIRDHVILEAKAMLRTGNHTVQEVSDALHFPNSSFFGKYFKSAVGMSPRRYMVQEK